MHLFKHTKFRTPESIELEFDLAGIGNRAWALVIDYHILAGILILFIVFWTAGSIQVLDITKVIFSNKMSVWFVAIALMICFFIYTGYFVFFETIWQGQTPGKRFAQIRVVRDNGRPIGLQQATLRALLRPFDEFFFIGVFLIIFGRSEKRLGDLAAGTIVIQNYTPAKSANIIISDQANSVYAQLLTIADFSIMLPDDFAVIREYLLRRNTMSSKAKASVARELSNQLLAILNLENIPESITPDTFLEAVYLAFQRE
ncbi:RDD family protein [Aetokthonos hydrillicola Thurmond2011]|jgi:uncharacterized RDD family membrane protein YckC|uniref:RDD family protein n=1 Tax=Aetokthonos hydrillicola Thurmond2011 TaxID=2712845 RepID=A0AAP5ICQ7_9CYAN|nr:RDD family protein [Aetokthonos hydrillicola]MBO3463308.1 RDD family protein [Aetokthonos hydrillicola CCALA 1050]MBW4585711.1 RDD family protein [Aetokthonos hydrillicola CCALA 1050]MDR9899215.1 RDD family protein [Aetokthonos hydrillicola Thurmond2011]